MRKLDVVGTTEIAEIVGVPPNTIRVWVKRGNLPEPDARLACGFVWRRSTIEAWFEGDGREYLARARGEA